MESILDPSLKIGQLGWERGDKRWSKPKPFHDDIDHSLYKLNPQFSNDKEPSVFADENQKGQWQYLQKIKNLYHEKKYRNRLRQLNPYEGLGNSVFIHHF